MAGAAGLDGFVSVSLELEEPDDVLGLELEPAELDAVELEDFDVLDSLVFSAPGSSLNGSWALPWRCSALPFVVSATAVSALAGLTAMPRATTTLGTEAVGVEELELPPSTA